MPSPYCFFQSLLIIGVIVLTLWLMYQQNEEFCERIATDVFRHKIQFLSSCVDAHRDAIRDIRNQLEVLNKLIRADMEKKNGRTKGSGSH